MFTVSLVTYHFHFNRSMLPALAEWLGDADGLQVEVGAALRPAAAALFSHSQPAAIDHLVLD